MCRSLTCHFESELIIPIKNVVNTKTVNSNLKNISKHTVIPAKAGILSIKTFSLVFVLIFLGLGCSNKTFDTEESLWTYLKDEDNGYYQEKEVNGYEFSLLYKPTDLLVKQELGEKKDAEKLKKLRDKYQKYMYFSLSMSKNNKELLSVAPKNRNEFGAMVNQLAFGMGNKVHLYNQHKDTIELADFVYPRMYGMSRSTDILFVYPREKEKLKKEFLNFTIEDLGIYTGEIRFKIPIKNIDSEPRLNI